MVRVSTVNYDYKSFHHYPDADLPFGGSIGSGTLPAALVWKPKGWPYRTETDDVRHTSAHFGYLMICAMPARSSLF